MHLNNIWNLGIKELRSLVRDPMLLALIIYSFTASVYTVSKAAPETLSNAAISIVDEDQSPLSSRIVSAFNPPYFLPPVMITREQMDARLDAGIDTFALDIPPDFQRDVLAGRKPSIQLNIDATRVSQALSGGGYVEIIAQGEVNAFVARNRQDSKPPVDLDIRVRFNEELARMWFGAVSAVINQVTLLSILLCGAALIREREQGNIEHLLAMPVTPIEIMSGKVWSMGLVVLVACGFSLVFVVQGLLAVPIRGSIPLFLLGAAITLFATTSMGIYMGTVAGNLPQFGLLLILTIMPLQMLSGGATPYESMPQVVQYVMLLAPTTHFVKLAQGIRFRDAGFDIAWPQFPAVALIGATFFTPAAVRFRKTIGTMGN